MVISSLGWLKFNYTPLTGDGRHCYPAARANALKIIRKQHFATKVTIPSGNFAFFSKA